MEYLRVNRRGAGGDKKRIAERLAKGDPGDEREFEMYPPNLKVPYRERQIAATEQRYAALGIPREDKEARRKAVAENWNSFDAPVTLFCYIDRNMGLPQWADLGMYLQTVMLLLRYRLTAYMDSPRKQEI